MSGVEADLAMLWTSGYVHLPKIAVGYSDMSANLSSAAVGAQAAFKKPGSDESPIFQAWAAIHDLAQRIADQSCINTIDTGQALIDIVNLYTESDLLTAEQISNIEDGIENYPKSKDDPNYNPESPVETPPEELASKPDTPSWNDLEAQDL